MTEPAAGPAILTGITAGLAAGHDVAAVLQRFLAPVMALAGAQAGAVRLLSLAGDQLELVAALGLPEGVYADERTVDRHCGTCGQAADGQGLVWTTDMNACAQHTPGPFFGQHWQRMLAVPMQHRGRTLGVYNLFFEGHEEPSATVLALLRSVAELLGLALNHERLEQQNLEHTLLRERQIMAAELHDSLAQSIAYLKMRMPLLQDALRAHDHTRALRHCEEVRGVATQAHASLRSMLTHFRAPMDPQGLVHALHQRLAQFRQQGDVQLDFNNKLPAQALTAEQQSQVFHVIDEALNNVVRHAHARHVSLHLALGADGRAAEITVQDDGTGWPQPNGPTTSTATPTGTHYGVEIMGERARRLGGTLQVGASAAGGTRVQLVFPLLVSPALMPGNKPVRAEAGKPRPQRVKKRPG